MSNAKYDFWKFKVKKLFDENYPNANYYRVISGNEKRGWLCEELDTKEIIIVKANKKENNNE